jgi:hypothetical protein
VKNKDEKYEIIGKNSVNAHLRTGLELTISAELSAAREATSSAAAL